MGFFFRRRANAPALLLLEAAIRLGLAGVLAWGLLVWATAAHFQEAGWQRLHGWTGTPGPPLTGSLWLGQPLLPEKGRPAQTLSHVSPRFATFSGRATGRVELLLLRGPDPPTSAQEIARRKVSSRIIPVERLSDNDLGRFNVPGTRLDKAGLFLLVRRPAREQGKPAPGPLTLWLDNDRDWPGGRALVITAGPGGELKAAPAAGHLSLGWGYDRPSVRVFLAQKPWLPWGFGGLWLGLSLLSLIVLPGAGGRLRGWWERLPEEGPELPRAKGPAWLPWAILAAGAAYTLFLQTYVREGVFFSGDAGIKLLMIEQYLSGRMHGFLELPGEPWVQELWRQGLYPFEAPFVHFHDGRWFVAFAQVFPLLNAPLYGLLGFRGLYVIPLAALWLLWLRFHRVGRNLGLGPWGLSLGLAGLVLASPLTLYSAMFWGHTLAVLIGFTGVSLALFPGAVSPGPRRLFLAGLVTGLGVWFRAETICLGGAATLALAALNRPGNKIRPAVLYGLGFGAGVILLWLAVAPLFGKYALGYGHPLGHHAVISGAGFDLSALLALLAKGREAFLRLQANLYAFFPLAGAAGVLLIGLALWKRVGWGRPLKALVIIYVLFILTASPILEPPGKQWGPRYMFLMLPLIALVAALAWQRIASFGPAWARLGVAAVLAWALVAGGSHNLGQGTATLERDYTQRVLPSLEFVRGRAEKIVAVSDQHIAQEMAAAIKGRTWFHTRESGERVLLAQALQERGVTACLYLFQDGEEPPQGFGFQREGRSFRAEFQPLGKQGRYRVALMRVGPV